MNSKQKKIVLWGLAVALIPMPSLAQTDIKLAIVWFAFVSLCVAYVIYRRNIGQELLVALLFSLFVTSYKASIYTSNNLLLGHINMYPLILWTAGLVILREIYEHLHVPHKWLVASTIYLIVLFCLEYIGYYILDIRISGNSPSLLGLGIIHGSLFIYWFYLCAGPVYLLATDYLRVR